MAAKSNHAMSCHAKNRGHLRISRRFNEAVKLGGVPAKVVLQKFLLGPNPVLEIRPMYATAPFEKLVGTFGDCRQDDLLVLFVSAFDRNHPVVAALSGLSLHCRSSS